MANALDTLLGMPESPLDLALLPSVVRELVAKVRELERRLDKADDYALEQSER